MTLDRQANSCKQPYLHQRLLPGLGKALEKYVFEPENMYNMDEKSLLLGYNNRAKVLVQLRRRAPTKTSMNLENELQLWNVHRQAGLC